MESLPTKAKKVHFIGVAGSGMSALAQFCVMGGAHATGSDRAFDQGGAKELAGKLKALGIVLYPQDGSALSAGPDEVVVSAAVEKGNADLVSAQKLGLPVLHRADCLARCVAERRAIAVAGTSGKSTTAAMIFEILRSAGRSPSIITGGPLASLQGSGLLGNAFRGKSDLLVVEADESDGTLARYKPWAGVLLNISKDHKEVEELRELFARFLRGSSVRVVHADVPEFATFRRGTTTFGFGAGDFRAEGLELEPEESRFRLSGVPFRLPLSGRHNVENALAAIAACSEAGVSLPAASGALSNFRGVARRFEPVGEARGVRVIDDFAHNPAKVSATLAAAHLRAARVHAVFQLHGFGPARFLKQELIDAFVLGLGPKDTLWMPEIYYAGGTADKTISARSIAEAIRARGRNARFLADRADIISAIAGIASAGDLILVMGARDQSLPLFARAVLDGIKNAPQARGPTGP